MLRFFLKKISNLAPLIAVSDIASTTTLCCMNTYRILQFFCDDYFENFLAPITFAKNFSFLAGVVSKYL